MPFTDLGSQHAEPTELPLGMTLLRTAAAGVTSMHGHHGPSISICTLAFSYFGLLAATFVAELSLRYWREIRRGFALRIGPVELHSPSQMPNAILLTELIAGGMCIVASFCSIVLRWVR